MAPSIIQSSANYTDEPDAEQPPLTAQIDLRSLADPQAQMPQRVPMTFVIVNGQRVAIPEGEDEGDDFDTIPPKPELTPPPPVDRPPVITNPLSVLGSTGSATGKALGALVDRPGDLPGALKAFGQELPRAAVAPSVSDLTSPSQELRQRGVEPGGVAGLAMDLALDPQNVMGGEPITDLGKLGVVGAMALPEGAQLLKGLASRLVTNVLPLIPEKGWGADRILSKIASGIASKDELAATGIGDWLKTLGGKIVTKAEFDQAIQEKGLPIYERWYGNDEAREALENRVNHLSAEVADARYYMGTTLTENLSHEALAQGRPLSPTESRAIIVQLYPNLADEPDHLLRYMQRAQTYFDAKKAGADARAALEAYPGGPAMATPKWGASYALPGGTNWRELTIGLAPDTEARGAGVGVPPGSFGMGGWKSQPYQITSVHKYDDPNMLLHVRAGDYLTDDGRKVLVINEAQSDAHSAAREAHEALVDRILQNHDKDTEVSTLGLTQKEQLARTLTTDPAELAALDKQGYGTVPEGFRHHGVRADVVPDIPFKGGAWQTLAMKRMIAYAAEHGYDEIAWTTGLQQSERYNKAMRDISMIKMTEDGRVEVYKAGGHYPLQTFGPFKHPSEAAPVIGADAARRLGSVPVAEPKWKYPVEGPGGKLIKWQEFDSEAAAEAQRALDQAIYHPADDPPSPASWWDLDYHDQERVEKQWRDALPAAVRRPYEQEAEASVERVLVRDAERKATRRGDRLTRSALNRLDLPDTYNGEPSLDWQTFRAEPVRQPTFGERAGATKTEQRGYVPRGDVHQPYTVRDAVVDRARAAGVDLDPESIALTPSSYEDVIRGRASTPGYYGSKKLKVPDSGALRTTTGRALTLPERHLVEEAMDDAFSGVEAFNEATREAIRAKYRAQAVKDKEKFIAAARSAEDYQTKIADKFENLLGNLWSDVDHTDRLARARELGIKQAFDPPQKELRPDTGFVGEIHQPNRSRKLDLTNDPLTISSKGMVQEYDKSLVDIANGLGKKYGVRVRPLEIQTAAKPDYGAGRPMRGPIRVAPGTREGAKYIDVLGEGDTLIARFQIYENTSEDLAWAEREAHKLVTKLKEDRTVWSLPLTPEMRESVKKTPFPLMAGLPPAIGTYVWLKNGQRVRVTQTHDDGTFDAEPAPMPKVIQQ